MTDKSSKKVAHVKQIVSIGESTTQVGLGDKSNKQVVPMSMSESSTQFILKDSQGLLQNNRENDYHFYKINS